MELLIFSDSHGKADRIAAVIGRNSSADFAVFLGDGLRDLARVDFGGMPVISVRGNCDVFSLFPSDTPPNELLLSWGEYTVLIAHGHTLGVKEDLHRAAEGAALRGVDILIFGHTHMRLDKYIPAGERIGDTVLKKPLRLFNPGSIGSPKDGRPSFGIIGIREGNVLTSHGYL